MESVAKIFVSLAIFRYLQRMDPEPTNSDLGNKTEKFPLVSCLMPTFNRRSYIPRALRCFFAQDYPNLELVVLDDGSDPIQNVLPDDPRIKYFYEQPKRNHGQKMNRCFELAQGEFGIVFDDDDFYPAHRISRYITPMIQYPQLVVTGTSTLYFYDLSTHLAYRYVRVDRPPATDAGAIGLVLPEHARPIRGIWMASIAVRKSRWAQARWDEIPAGADYNFLRQTPAELQYDLDDPSLVIAAIHQNNACKKVIGRGYRAEPWDTIVRLTGGDL
jgi:glycosyltransferase involved in cell wall biosynthesis